MTSVHDTSLGLLSILQSQGSLQSLSLRLQGWAEMLDVHQALAAIAPNSGPHDLTLVTQDIYQLATNARHLSPPIPMRGPEAVLKRVYDLYLRDFNSFAREWGARHRPCFTPNGDPSTREGELAPEILRWWTSDDPCDRTSALEFWRRSTPLERRQGLNLIMSPRGFCDLETAQARRILDLAGFYGSPIEIGLETMPQAEGARLVLGDENSARTTQPGAIMSEHIHPLRDQDYLGEAAYTRGTPSAFREDHVSDDLRVLLSEARESLQRFFIRRVLHPNSGTIYTYDAAYRRFQFFLGVNDADSENPSSGKLLVNALRKERREYLLGHLTSLRRTTEKNGYEVHFHEVPYGRIMQRRLSPSSAKVLLESPAQDAGKRPKLFHQVLKFFER